MTRLRRLTERVRAAVDRFAPRGALLLSALSIGYFAAGILRNRAFAAQFGASAELDAYNAAFRIPEIALDILVGAGLSAPFVPIFSRLLRGATPEADPSDGDTLRRPSGAAAQAFGQTVLTGAIGAMSVALVVLFAGAPWLADTVWGSFDAPTRALYVELVRINCAAQLMFAASMALGEILVARRRFLAYGIAPILYTGGIVVGTVLLGPRIGVLGAAWGAVIGASLHLGARAIGATRAGFRIRLRLAFRTAEFREFLRLMIPRMLSYPIDPIVVSYLTVLAVGIGPGNASALSFVLDYQFVPVQVIAIAFSIAAFPILSEAWNAGDRRQFRRVFARNVVTIGGLTTLAAIALAILAEPLVSRLLGVGRFDAAAVALTAGLLVAFSLSIPIDSLSYPLSRALYATHNTIWQVLASLIGLAALVASAQVLVPALGAPGIAAAYTVGGAAKLVVLALAIATRLRSMDAPGTAAAAMGSDGPPAAISPAGSSG